MAINYDTDLLKHYVRTDGWLPICRKRLGIVRAQADRRLKYFTFCATGAIDVLMLDVANVVKRSKGTERFDTVAFFGRDHESIIETQKRIPGAIGFPGNFIEVVLHDDPDEAAWVEGVDPLNSPENQKDEAAVRQIQRTLALKAVFIKQFPFDVINLDLEEFLFRPSEALPGKVVKALRKMFRWQRQPLVRPKGAPLHLTGFSLMFTTRIGPPNITNECLDMLEKYLRDNLQNDPRLSPILRNRSGTDNPTELRGTQPDLFFKLAMPKVLAGILLEEDWYIEPEYAIKIYEYGRADAGGRYQMLHLVMDVRRQQPHRDQRVPVGPAGQVFTADASEAYREVAMKLFTTHEQQVIEANLNSADLNANLELIKLRRKKYHPDDI